ncbi:uncharacterized protein ISCGN_032948 [Ixodes scapularis]
MAGAPQAPSSSCSSDGPGDSAPASKQQSQRVEEPSQIQANDGATRAQLRIIHLLVELRHQNREMQHETMQLRLDVQQLSDQIAALEVPTGQAAPIPTAAILPRELPRLPASTLEELEAAEAAIHDEAVATVLKEQLLRIGGRTLLETTANVMKVLMGHSVQVLFSLYGRKGKRPFNSMQLCRVAIDANCEKQAVDRTTALAVIGKWLPGSVDRGGGRKRRFAAMIAEPSAQLSAEPSAQPPAEPPAEPAADPAADPA